LLLTILLSLYGAVMIFSATVQSQQAAGLDPNAFVKRQIAFLFVATGALIVVNLFDYRHLRDFAWVIYGITIVALMAVLSPLGQVQLGAKRWIDLGGFQAQPSELAKIAVIVAVGAYLAERKGDIRVRDVAIVCAAVLLAGALIYLEPDLGTMLVFVALAGAMLLVAGAKVRHFLALGILGVIAVVAVI
jgi:cell division protein FtsW (lipid II flippase)